MDIERIAEIKDQLAVIRTYSAPYIEEIRTMFVEYWNDGHTVSEIAEAFDWKPASVKTRLTELGIDWRARADTPIEPVSEELRLVY